MTQVNKNDVNQIFASNAPDQDKPPSFNNYTNGWGESRTNNGKPTIKQLNFTQQRTDQNLLWIHQNGGALPYDSSIEYADGVIVLKEGRLSKLVDGSWIDVLKSENEKALPPYYSSNVVYDVGSRIMLDDNSEFVVSTASNNTNNPNTNLNGWRKATDKSSISFVDSISSLLLLDTWNGRAIDVLSYRVGESKGGGRFVYDSKKLDINNGVTVFNGWVRDLSGKKISTDDAGLVSSTDNNSAIFKVITDALDHNFTLEINCKVCVSTQQVIQNKNGIKVVFGCDGLLSAKEYRKDFVHWGTAGNRGILTFIDCYYPQVFYPKIIGAKSINLNVPETRADGDAGIHFKRCMHYSIYGSDISHAYTWGIIGEQSSYGIASNNKVYDVCVQAGISLSLSGGTNNTVKDNTIYNCGLAGIEWESADKTRLSLGNFSYGNYVSDCTKGETIVDNIHGVTSFNNRFVRCSNGFIGSGTTIHKDKIQLLESSNNNYIDCGEGFTLSDAYGFDIHNNNVYAPIIDQYLNTNPYNVALDFPSSTTFRVNGGSNSTNNNDDGGNYKVNDKFKFAGLDTIYTVTAVSRIVDDTYGMGYLRVVTVDSAIDASVEPCTNVLKLNKNKVGVRCFNTQTSTFTGQNGNLVFNANNFHNCFQAVISFMQFPPVSDNSEVYSNNNFYNCPTILYIPFGRTTGLKWFDNKSDGGNIDFGAGGGTSNARYVNYFPKPKMIKVYNSQRSTETLPIPKLSFYLKEDTNVIGARLTFPYADAKTTGAVVVKIDDANSYVIGVGGLNNTVNNVNFYAKLNSGIHTIQLPDTVGDLTYKECIVELFVV